MSRRVPHVANEVLRAPDLVSAPPLICAEIKSSFTPGAHAHEHPLAGLDLGLPPRLAPAPRFNLSASHGVILIPADATRSLRS